MKRELAEQLFRGAEILDIYIDEEMLAKFSLYLENCLHGNEDQSYGNVVI